MNYLLNVYISNLLIVTTDWYIKKITDLKLLIGTCKIKWINIQNNFSSATQHQAWMHSTWYADQPCPVIYSLGDRGLHKSLRLRGLSLQSSSTHTQHITGEQTGHLLKSRSSTLNTMHAGARAVKSTADHRESIRGCLLQCAFSSVLAPVGAIYHYHGG